MKARLISIWEAPKAKNTYVAFHSHGYYELVYYPAGSGVTTIGGAAHAFCERSYAVIPPAYAHDERHYADGAVICLLFDADVAFKTGIRKDALGNVQRLLREMLNEAQSQRYGYGSA